MLSHDRSNSEGPRLVSLGSAQNRGYATLLGKVNSMHIGRVLESVPTQLSAVQDASVARYKFRGVVPGVTHYDRLAGAIDWLESAGLIVKASIVNAAHMPLGGYVKENFFKLMLFDVGLLGCMSGIAPKTILEYDYGSYKGYMAENYVAQELLASGFESLYSWHEKNHEVEFLLEIEGKVVPLEVKSGSIKKTKSLDIFCEKYHPPYRVICSGLPLHVDNNLRISLYLVNKISSFDSLLRLSKPGGKKKKADQ